MSGLDLTNLKGADTKGFAPLPPGQYDAVVYEAKTVEVKPDTTGTLPPGTPGVSVQFKIDGGEYNNRRVFTRYWIPPKGHDAGKAEVMNNMLASFLVAIGYDKDEVTSGTFSPELEDFAGRECRVGVRISNYDPNNNEVTSVRARNAEAGSALL